jgi:excinuclease UvrABC helicase subunit UvrB
MAKSQTPIIRIVCYGLPYVLSNQMYNEFESRFKDAKYLIKTYDYYKPIRRNIETVELLLALSIFHKRVISNLDSAIKFYGTVNRISKADTIRIGNYDLNKMEMNMISSVIINYRTLINKYNLPSNFFEYIETKELVRKILNLKLYRG